ncbi:MAG: ABC transporter C-terminal domain-containing protein [Blastocatellia bacterium]
MAGSEARKAEIEAQLASDGSDHVLVGRLYDELQTLNDTLNRDLDRWATLAEISGV